jgi:hypothetical protein
MVPVTAWDWTCIKLWSSPSYRGLKWAGNGIKGKPPFQGAYIHFLFDIWRIRLVVFERTDRDQRHSQIAHFF